MASLPLVGLPTDSKPIGSHPFLVVGEKYVRAVVDGAQATPLVLPLLQPPLPADAWLRQLDGLLLTGATSNIEPHHYDGSPSWEGNPHDPARDANVFGLIPQALAMRLPILAICRGFQEINVAFGGSLHPKVHEVPGLADHREDPDSPTDVQYGPAHALELVPGGLLAGIAAGQPVRVNTVHGQGVARLGNGLQAEAHAPDGLIEAFRGPGPGFLLGVQFHPEWRVLENPFYLGIFQAFGEACRRYQMQKQRS
ncbi:gamma-glutamyl-gamma-aminobutyrate hydrolase family protein [Stenotrophomonas sp. SY1]|uniref:gamma-glutamyl-gamma-aminobutyrate hydrolase family protein n=1 Tax=Stenotrophomonas sp. SY1 TaxID=477235 RepID=UPI001E62BE98|nr:gamma-glutamyl-gamma-aminobutyrate hydrolase family protein [Stenotrophomonas sp. SY1]MCD9086473.1 gamma-glutamyl-gamma-aminobutyrate hydrolase family protein [Stenotrophomonas sp. SY1]